MKVWRALHERVLALAQVFGLAGLAIVVVLALAAFLFRWGYDLVDDDAHTYYLERIAAFKEADARLNEHILMASAGLLQHYDPLVNGLVALRELGDQLANMPHHVRNRSALTAIHAQLDAVIQQKSSHIENFKTRTSAVRNALTFLPALAQELTEKVADKGPDSALPGLVQTVLSETVFYYSEPAPNKKRVIEQHIKELWRSAEDELAQTELAGVHAFSERVRGILEVKAQINESVEHLLGARGASEADRLRAAYMAQHRRTQRTARTYQLALFALALVITLYFVCAHRLALQAHAQSTERVEAGHRALAVKDEELSRGRAACEEAKEEARLSHQRFLAMVEDAQDLIAVVSRDDHFTYASPSLPRVLGLGHADLIGKSVYDGVHPDDLFTLQDYIKRAHEGLNTEHTVSYRVLDSFGTWHDLETRASNHFANPAVRGIVLNSRDTTSIANLLPDLADEEEG